MVEIWRECKLGQETIMGEKKEEKGDVKGREES